MFVLTYRDMINVYLNVDGVSMAVNTNNAMTFDTYSDAKDYRKSLPNPRHWLIEEIK